MHVVLICNNSRLAQVVLYALRANGIRPSLVCNRRTAGSLRASRLVAGTLFLGAPGAEPDVVAGAINRAHRRDPVDLVMAADVDGLCLLADIRAQIEPPVFPMAPRPVLERLNNKWTFHGLCDDLNLRTPATLFIGKGQRLDGDRIARETGFPAVIKPVGKWASIGMQVVRARAALQDGDASENVVVQTYVPGRDVGLGLFARDGRSLAACTFYCGERDATEFADMPDLRRMGDAIVAATGFSGVANFDARLDEAGRFWLLECNPRFFMRLGAARMCGLDLLKLGLPGRQAMQIPTASGSYIPRSDILSPSGLWRAATQRSAARIVMHGIGEAVADPVPLLLRRLGYDQMY